MKNNKKTLLPLLTASAFLLLGQVSTVFSSDLRLNSLENHEAAGIFGSNFTDTEFDATDSISGYSVGFEYQPQVYTETLFSDLLYVKASTKSKRIRAPPALFTA